MSLLSSKATMSITPPSLPSISLRESTFDDDSSLALQAIAVEQTIAGLQKLGSASEQLLAQLGRQQAALGTITQLQTARDRLQQAELNATQANLAMISNIGTELPANVAELQEFLAARGLPSDLATESGRQAAVDALAGYAADVQLHPNTIDNPAVEQQIAQDVELQQSLRDANIMLGANDDYVRPADLASLQATLTSEATRLTQAVRDEVAQLVRGAQQVVVLTTDNATLGSQLVTATTRGQQVASARLEAAQREIDTQTQQLNLTVRDLNNVAQVINDGELATRLASLVDQAKGSIQRLQALVAIIQPDAAVAALRNSTAIDQRASVPTTTLFDPTSNQVQNGAAPGAERPPRLIDPNRLV